VGESQASTKLRREPLDPEAGSATTPPRSPWRSPARCCGACRQNPRRGRRWRSTAHWPWCWAPQPTSAKGSRRSWKNARRPSPAGSPTACPPAIPGGNL